MKRKWWKDFFLFEVIGAIFELIAEILGNLF